MPVLMYSTDSGIEKQLFVAALRGLGPTVPLNMLPKTPEHFWNWPADSPDSRDSPLEQLTML
jgi:hypothetical protein